MKALKLISIAIVSFLLTDILDAQEYDFSTERLNGLEVRKFYTEEQFIEAFGEPDYISSAIHDYFVYERVITSPSPAAVEDIVGGVAAEKITDGIGFISNQDGEYSIEVYTIRSDQIVFNDYIRVGDHVSKVFDMGGTTLECKNEDGSGYIYWVPEGGPEEPYIEWNCFPAFYYDKNGIIEMIQSYND